jgi:YggT family protein
MIDNRQPVDTSMDRREETVSTQQPGFASTEQVTRDVAAERRQSNELMNQILYTLLGILEIGLGLRLILKLIAANAASGFADFIYGITGPFIAPFAGLVGTPSAGGSILEITTLIAMAVYALLVWIIIQVLAIAMARPSARSVSRTTSEQAPGTQRTTHTINS